MISKILKILLEIQKSQYYFCLNSYIFFYLLLDLLLIAQSAGAVEYTDYTSAEG